MSSDFSSPPGSPCLIRQSSKKQDRAEAEFRALMAKNPTMTWEDLVAAARAELEALPSPGDRNHKQTLRAQKLIGWTNQKYSFNRAQAREDRERTAVLKIHDTQSKTTRMMAGTTRIMAGDVFGKNKRHRADSEDGEARLTTPPPVLKASDGQNVEPADPDIDPDCLPGLREVLRIGASSLSDVTLPEDIEVAGVNISSLLRLVFRDVLVDAQLPDKEKEFSPKSVLRAVTRGNGLLLDLYAPSAYLRYVTEEEYAEVYKTVCGADGLWDAMSKPPSPDTALCLESFQQGIRSRKDWQDLALRPASGKVLKLLTDL
ncbi:hypothetical protein HDU87_001952 [Geranomyces variabilis]|uniref:Uncharacterized protein n=1 Tax=Geranomyces variabilis TaxID=109894 RepID=A0AAD5XRL3_9FUNG|nr:hypothetical protein HDU87_001952 [Geranomyces variabilis]